MVPIHQATKVLALASAKGGAGKSTLALHLAVAADGPGARVALVDLDPQGTVTRWYDRRQAVTPALVVATAGRLADVLAGARGDGYALAVLDTPPHAAAVTREAVRRADLVLIPLRPAPADLDALPETVALVGEHGTAAAFVLNAVPAVGAELADARAFLRAQYPAIATCPVGVGSRKAFYLAQITGQTANEYDPNGKAAHELERLWRWVRRRLWPEHP